MGVRLTRNSPLPRWWGLASLPWGSPIRFAGAHGSRDADGLSKSAAGEAAVGAQRALARALASAAPVRRDSET